MYNIPQKLRARACVYMYMCVCVCGTKETKYKPKPGLSLSDGGPTNLQKLFIWISSIVIVF